MSNATRMRLIVHRAGLAARINNRRGPNGLTVYRIAVRRYRRAIG